MALKSTIFKAALQIADIDHSYYADHTLTLARHPSETDERMMVRLAALALQATSCRAVCNGDGTLGFGAGLSDPDEPDVVLRDFTGRTRLWIEVGQPDDKPLIKACGKADEVVLYCFRPCRRDLVARHREQAGTAAEPAACGACPPTASQALAQTGPAQHAAAGHDAGRRADAGRRRQDRGHRTRAPEVRSPAWAGRSPALIKAALYAVSAAGACSRGLPARHGFRAGTGQAAGCRRRRPGK
jgi:uncharacterized protein YaeQ